jgi:hypothetical protein
MESNMPENDVIRRAKARKAPSTPAGEFVGEGIELIRSGVDGAPSTSQAIAMISARNHATGYPKSIDFGSSEKLFEELPLGECYVRLKYSDPS